MSLKILMLGPSGVGKTSLLAAMRETFQRNAVGLVLRPLNDTSVNLDVKWTELFNVEQGEVFEEARAGAVQTTEPEIYEFELKAEGQTSGERLEIVDIRGGMVNKQDVMLNDLIDSSTVIFHVVDSAAMMELQDQKARKHNEVGNVVNLLKQRTTGTPLLIVTILTKCEKYLRHKQEADLRACFSSQFDGLLKFVNSKGTFSHKLVAVETLGCVHFSRIVRENDSDRLVFIKKGGELKPSRLETPLQLAIQHAFQEYSHRKSFPRKVLDWMTRKAHDEARALKKFSEDMNSKDLL